MEFQTAEDLIAEMNNFDNWPFDIYGTMEVILPGYQGMHYVDNETDWNAITNWDDPRPQPTWAEIVAAGVVYRQRLRAYAYRQLEHLRSIYSWVTYNGKSYEATTEAYNAVCGIATAVLANPTGMATVNWFNAEDGPVQLTAAQFMELHALITANRNGYRAP